MRNTTKPTAAKTRTKSRKHLWLTRLLVLPGMVFLLWAPPKSLKAAVEGLGPFSNSMYQVFPSKCRNMYQIVSN